MLMYMGKARALQKLALAKQIREMIECARRKMLIKYSKNYARIRREDAMSTKDGMNFDK